MKIVYRGKPVIRDDDIEDFASLVYSHSYHSSLVTGTGKHQHACFELDKVWCWKNALDNPLMALRFIWRKAPGLTRPTAPATPQQGGKIKVDKAS